MFHKQKKRSNAPIIAGITLAAIAAFGVIRLLKMNKLPDASRYQF